MTSKLAGALTVPGRAAQVALRQQSPAQPSMDPAFLDLRLDRDHWAAKALSGKPASAVKSPSDWRLDDRESCAPPSCAASPHQGCGPGSYCSVARERLACALPGTPLGEPSPRLRAC